MTLGSQIIDSRAGVSVLGGAVGDQPQWGGGGGVLLHPVVTDVVDEPSVLLVLPDLIPGDGYQCLAVNVILEDAIVVVDHSRPDQLPPIPGGHPHDLIKVVLEPGVISFKGVGDIHALVLWVVRQAVLQHLQLLLLLPVQLLGLEGTLLQHKFFSLLEVW